MQRSRLPFWLQFLVVHNPFYLVSAGFFVYGLKLLFRPESSQFLFEAGSVGYIPPWPLLLSLAGVTVLMASTAVGVVRWGRVWEDARSLMLIVFLMFMAIAVSFDEVATLMAEHTESGFSTILMCGVLCLFVLATTELMLRGMQIRIARAWRIPLHLLLLSLLAWPLLLVPVISGASQIQVRWLIAAYPTVAGLITLLLIPAVRQGSASCNHNGTPWSWPWVPWTGFVFVGLAVCFRAYSLTISFDAPVFINSFWDTSFSLYSLAPFLLAVLVVVLEVGLVERLPRLQKKVLLLAPLLLLLAHPWLVPWHQFGTYRAFTASVTSTAGSPLFLAVLGVLGFYAWAWFRGAVGGRYATLLMLTVASVCDPGMAASPSWSGQEIQVHPWSLAVLGTLLTAAGLRHHSSGETFSGFVSLSIAAGMFFRGTELGHLQILLSGHLIWVAMLIVGARFSDDFSAVLRVIAAPLGSLLLLMVLAKAGGMSLGIAVYGTAMTGVILVYGLVTTEWIYYIVVLGHTTLASLFGVVWFVRFIWNLPVPRGTHQVVLASLSFLLAVGISLVKGRQILSDPGKSDGRTPLQTQAPASGQ